MMTFGVCMAVSQVLSGPRQHARLDKSGHTPKVLLVSDFRRTRMDHVYCGSGATGRCMWMPDATERMEVSLPSVSEADGPLRAEMYTVPSVPIGSDERVRALEEEVNRLLNVIAGLERELAEACAR